MDKYIGMIILKPDIKKGKIDFVQSNIINLFKQTTKVERIWYLGKRQLDYKTKKYSEVIYLKIEILAKDKKIEKIKEILRQNENVIFSIIMNNESEKNKADGYIMPYGDSPLDSENAGESVYLDILNTAKKYVHIMTPYLIIDNEMMTALTYAAKRGIDIKIILPSKPDKLSAFMLAKTYYSELLQAGVRIYEYTPGFVHAKLFSSDDEKVVVGTINLDFRSLYLHFECATFIYKNKVIKSIEEDFIKTLNKCKEITIKEYKDINVIFKICGRDLKLIAPLM